MTSYPVSNINLQMGILYVCSSIVMTIRLSCIHVIILGCISEIWLWIRKVYSKKNNIFPKTNGEKTTAKQNDRRSACLALEHGWREGEFRAQEQGLRSQEGSTNQSAFFLREIEKKTLHTSKWSRKTTVKSPAHGPLSSCLCNSASVSFNKNRRP